MPGGDDLGGQLPGGAATCSPTTKKVALRARARERPRAPPGVPSGCGPSSKVSATPPPSGAIVRGTFDAARGRGVDGSEQMADHARMIAGLLAAAASRWHPV